MLMTQYMYLTRLQRRIVNVFRQRADAGLAPPTYRELCREFSWRSTGTARDHLKALIRKGALDSGLGTARGIRLRLARTSETATLPLIGLVTAGKPVACDEIVDREIAVPSFLAPAGNGFLLRVSGDSMEGAGIIDGDFVVVREGGVPRSGDIVAVTISGETTLKWLEKHERDWVLAPDNPKYEPIPIKTENVIVHGIVTGVLRAVKGSSSATHLRSGTSGGKT